MDDRFERQAALAAISSHKDEILSSCQEDVDLLDALEELTVITQNEKDKANESDEYGLVIPRLEEKIDLDPGFFNKFCHHISQKKELLNLAKSLVGTYSKATLNEQSTATPAESASSTPRVNLPETNEECSVAYTVLDSLKKKLSDYKRSPTQSEESIKRAIVDAIAEESSGDTQQMNKELFKIHQEEIISREIYEWAIAEIQQKEKEKEQDTVTDSATLDDDDLYHASLCTKVVNESINDVMQCSQLLQSSSRRSLEAISMTQLEDQGAFPKCMIALFSDDSGNKTCFVAFEDFKFQKILCDEHSGSTFGTVFESQIEKFPTLYLEKVIKTVNRVVITGFCFGGVLAQLLAARLWLLPLTDPDQLMSSLVCITFGQPLIQSEQLSNVAHIFPYFRNSVYAIGLDNDKFPSIIERLDSLTSTTQGGLPAILGNLSYLQEFYLHQKQEESMAQGGHSFSLMTPANSDQELPTEVVIEAQEKLKNLLHSQQTFPCETSAAAQRKVILHDDTGLKLVESLLEDYAKVDLVCQNFFDQHTTNAYHGSIEKLICYHQEHKANAIEIPSEFLCPNVERVKIILYGNEAIIEVGGQQLWFVHSIKLSPSIIKDPVQVKEFSVSFKTNADNIVIPSDQEESEVVIFSYFHCPFRQKLTIEVDLDRLSPRSRQLAKLEPEVILEFAFTMSLLETCPNRLNCSGSQPGESSFFKFFEKYLRDIASVVPYESILCTVAQCNNKQVVERCMRTVKELKAEFPFSLMMYTSLFVHTFKIQHREQKWTSTGPNFFDQQPFEVCAYFTWSKAKYTAKGIPSKAAVESFSKEVFADPYIFRSQDPHSEELLYLRKMVQDSLKQVNSLSEVEAISSKSAADLYNMNYYNIGPSSTSEKESVSLQSPIEVLKDGRETLHRNIDKPALISEPHSNEEAMKIIKQIRKIHIDFCIRVLCGFVYQHVQVPFTEANPMTYWKHLRYKIAPYSDILKDDSIFWVSLLNRCQRAIAKGSQVAERTYNGKLKFLVSNIVPESEAHTGITSTEYSVYMLEKKLEKVCSERKIKKETSIDQMIHEWQTFFKGCPLANVADSHRSLVSRWIKWSLMVQELRLMLENHITIAITGLVNSGKTQLIRSLFAFDVKAGTSESRRTIVPFMYTLAPDVEGVHVVDMPGADDSDKNVLRLTDFLKSISQVVVFVIRQDKIVSSNAKAWLPIFETRGKGSDKINNPSDASSPKNEDTNFPLLVCMTYADKVVAEMMNEQSGKYSKSSAKQEVEEHFEEISRQCFDGQSMWKPQGKRTLGYYCLDLSNSTLQESDMRAVSIGVPSDVGNWLCQQLREELCAYDTANKLEAYFKKSCSKL